MNYLDVISFVANSSEVLFDGLPIQRGTHLYWTWHRRLPYPLGGFSIIKGENPPEIVARLPVPAGPDEVLRRLERHPDFGALQSRFTNASQDIYRLLAELSRPPDPFARHHRLLPETGERSVIRLRIQDALLMGCLDPYIAQMTGVYYVDTSADPSRPGLYRVVGHWGSEPWPNIQLSFDQLPPISQVNAPLRLGDLQIIPLARRVSVNEPAEIDIYDKHLIASGSAVPALRFQLDYPIESFVLQFYESWSPTDATPWQILIDGEATPVFANANSLGFIRAGRSFQTIDIVNGPAGTWRFAHVAFQERSGPIGDQVSAYFEPRLIPAASKRVTTPGIQQLNAQAAAPIFDSQGFIRDHHSDVKVYAHTQAPEDYVHQAVRLFFSKVTGATAGAAAGDLQPLNEIGVVDPLPIQNSREELSLPELQAYFPFNRHLRNVKNGLAARTRGRYRFTKGHPKDESRYVLQLDGNGFLALNDTPKLKSLGNTFSFHCWLRVDADNPEPYPTIVGNRWDVSFWWGLARTNPGEYRMRFWMSEHNSGADRQFQSDAVIRAGEWVSIGVSYNGQQVRFYYNGNLDRQHTAALGDVLWNPADLSLGAESGSTVSTRYFPFKGALADLAVWKRRIGPKEGMVRINSAQVYFAQQEPYAALAHRHFGKLDFSLISELIRLPHRPHLQALGNAFTIQLWVKPWGTAQSYPTLIGNNWSQSFWLGLQASGDQYIPRLWLNKHPDNFNNVFHSSQRIPADKWSLLTFCYDGQRIRFYVNGRAAGTHTADLGLLRTNTQAIALGADATSTPTRKDYPYVGELADLQIWQEALSPAQIEFRLSVHQWTDRGLADDRYHYYARGVDIFGRVSSWSSRRSLTTASEPEHSAPVNVQAQFRKFNGQVTGVTVTETGFLLTTDLNLPPAILPALEGYDVKLTRLLPMQDPPFDQPPRRQPVVQHFTITAATLEDDVVQLAVEPPPYAFFFPEDRRRDALEIEFDMRFAVKWAWSGLQQLYHDSVDGFHLYLKQGSLNVLRGQVTAVSTTATGQFSVRTDIQAGLVVNELSGTYASIGPNKYRIRSHSSGRNLRFELEYLGEPIVTPEIDQLFVHNLTADHSAFVDYNDTGRWGHAYGKVPLGGVQRYASNNRTRARVDLIASVTPEQMAAGTIPAAVERRQLLDQGVDWMPTGPFYKISFRRFNLPSELRRLPAADYVPGALVGFVQQNGQNRWRDNYVFWHSWQRNQLIVYALPHEKGEAVPRFLITDLTPCRLYIGKQFSLELDLPAVPEFPVLSPNLSFNLSIAASDSDGHFSAISPIVRMIAVNRRRPPRPPAPRIVSISRLDYYQQSKVEVAWDALEEAGISYLLFRATDTAIFTQDLYLRRTRQGVYRGLPPGRVFEDDPDMAQWVVTKATRIGDLFPRAESPDWKTVTPIWRAWAERFYPALTPAQVSNLANAPGNERAFTLLNAKPTPRDDYLDVVNGRINNRYCYRLRSQSVALQQSTQWGTVSDPAVPPLYRPPAKPTFTRVEAGDRSVSLSWSMNREANLSEYVLYRGESTAQMEDLRWWSIDPDPRIVAHIADPRIKALNRSIYLPGTLAIGRVQDVLGVYRLDEFNFGTEDPRTQPQALNYWVTRSSYPLGRSVFTTAADESGRHELSGLRPVADGVALVVVYRDADDRVFKVLAQYHGPDYEDTGLLGLTDYFYRLLAVDQSGNRSEASVISRVRTLELTDPASPAVEMVRENIAGRPDEIRVTIAVSQPGLEMLLQWKRPEDRFWRTALNWTATSGTHLYTDTADPAETRMYRALVRGSSKRTSDPSDEVIAIPNDPILDDLLS